MELAPVLEVVPGLLYADAQAVPLRQRRLVPVLHGARRVERLALRVRVVGLAGSIKSLNFYHIRSKFDLIFGPPKRLI